jgi:membrane protein DedA with SNARE-associated domain
MSQPVQLPGFLEALVPPLDHWGYLAAGFLSFAGRLRGARRLNIVAAGVIGFTTAVHGGTTGHAIGRFGGRTLVLSAAAMSGSPGERLATAGSFFTRHRGKIVIVARFIEGLHQANGIIAGITTMPWLRFLAFNALGPALRVSAWPSAGEEPPPGSDWGRTCQG